MVLLKLGIVAQVIGHRVMHNGHVVAAGMGRGVCLAQDGRRLGDQAGGEVSSVGVSRSGQFTTGRGGGNHLAVLADDVRIQHVGAGLQHAAHQLLVGEAGGVAHFLGRQQDHRVNGLQLQHVGDGHILAVLLDGHLDAGGRQLASLRDDAFLQLVSVGEGVKLAPLHLVAVVGGQGLLRAKLAEEHHLAGVLQHFGVVVHLHLGAHRAGRVGGTGVGVDVAGGGVGHSAGLGKHLKIEQILDHGISPLLIVPSSEEPVLLTG